MCVAIGKGDRLVIISKHMLLSCVCVCVIKCMHLLEENPCLIVKCDKWLIGTAASKDILYSASCSECYIYLAKIYMTSTMVNVLLSVAGVPIDEDTRLGRMQP